MNHLVGDFILFASLFGIFLSLLLLYYIKRSSKSNIYLSIFFFLNSIYGLSAYILAYSGSALLLAPLYGTVAPLFFLLGPAGFFYIRSVLRDDARLSKWDMLHFIPFLVQLVNALPYIFTSYAYKVQYVTQLANDIGMIPYVKTGWFITPMVNYLLRPGHIFIYAVWQSVILYKWMRKDEVLMKLKEIVIQWLYLFNVVCLILFGSFFVVTIWAYTMDDKYAAIHQGRPLLKISFVPFILLNGLIFLFPQILYGIPRWRKMANMPPRPGVEESTVQQDQNSSSLKKELKKGLQMKDEALDSLHRQIEAYLVSQKPFLQKEFSLAKMSVETDIPAHHLSYYFNYYLKEKFTDWRNRHRVAYAVELIKSGQSEALSLEGIALQSGFSSRTTFFTAFKGEMGMSPSQYSEHIGLNEEVHDIGR
jgi:AraC-like DNA-binding protein